MGTQIGFASGALAAERLGTLLLQRCDFGPEGIIGGLARCLRKERQGEASEQARAELHASFSRTVAQITQSIGLYRQTQW
jgi:hypothetical protein